MMKFVKYPKIAVYKENSRSVNILKEMFANDELYNFFIVEEKIHGANFSFYYDGTTLLPARRNGFIKEGEKFFNYQEAVRKHRERIVRLYYLLKEKGKVFDYIIVTGELFGGFYDEKTDEGSSKIAKGVQYLPFNDIIFYDIKLVKEEKGIFLPLMERSAYLRAVGLKFSKVISSGRFNDCVEHETVFQTIIPEDYGQERIEGNNAEGVIIRPGRDYYFPNGKRIIFKNKNPMFTDKAERKEKKPVDNEKIDKLKEYINRERFDSAMSKLPEPQEMKEFPAVIKEMCSDILTELKDDGVDDPEHRKILGSLVPRIIKEWFLELL